MGSDDSPPRRVAVVAIHGVADQERGETAQALAELLISQAPNGAAYARGQRGDLVLQVPPLQPLANLGTADPGMKKEARQSVASDYLREGGNAHGNARTLDARPQDVSQGVAFTSYLLAKAQANQTSAETYTMPVISLLRRTQAADDRVDLHEMYWADLSRLAGNVPTIVTELFTFLFRLSQLGRDTVQMQAAVPQFAASRAWRVLRRCQTTLDWMYSRVLALLFLQLIMFTLILVPFGLAWHHEGPVYVAASVLLVVAVASVTLYRWRRPALSLLAACAAAFLLWKAQPGSAWMLGALWLILLGFAYEAWMRMCEERFPLVRAVGNVLGVMSAIIVIFYGVQAGQLAKQPDLQMWITGAISGVECVLVMIVVWWFVAGCVLVVWLISGVIAARSSEGSNVESAAGSTARAAQGKASIATGRMGLVVSLGFFVVLSMTAWALLTKSVEKAVTGMPYTPIAFQTAPDPRQPVTGVGSTGDGGGQHASTPPQAGTNAEQLEPCSGLEGAPLFLCQRFVNSTETFALIAIFLFVLLGYLLLMLAPSMLAEMSVAKLDGPKLGLWLTRGYRWIEPVTGAVVALGVIAALVIGIVLMAFRLDVQTVMAWATSTMDAIRLSEESRKWLAVFVVGAGGTTIALAAAGRLLSRYVPWLRAPLDAALDVDSHFREFPRTAIPRARIFSRLASVLQHVAEGDYDHVVIVSHSQGTVIAAELLRYLKEVSATGNPDPRTAWVWSRLKDKVALVTVGCPLRQLYAARFPVLYDWVLGEHGGSTGPAAADIGATRWVNLYATGDYVGRWLWSRPPLPAEYPPSEIDESAAAHTSTYIEPTLDTTDAAHLMRDGTEKDICLGPGAHTHYFDRTQETVARVVDAMLVGV